MLKPSVRVQTSNGLLIADFWDCLRLDPAPVRDLLNHYNQHLASGGRPDLIVDLSGVDFAGSSALGAFNALQRACSAGQGRICFCHVEPAVREVFRVSRLESLYLFASDVDSATRLASSPSTSTSRTQDSKPPPLARRKRAGS